MADWYRSTILETAWGFPPERFRSQDFWDALEQILPEGLDPLSSPEDPWDQAQLRLLGLWKEKQMVSRRLLSYDTTHFYTYIASHNTRTELAQRGHNKPGRHNLRQVGLSYVLDGEHGLSLCHHVYRGNIADSEEFSTSLARRLGMLDRTQMARDTVTLVWDKGGAALANTVQLEEAGVGWIAALPWNQAPVGFRERAVEPLPPCSSVQPGVRAAAEKLLVHGQEYLCVLQYSASLAGEQLHSLSASLSKVLQSLCRFSMEWNKPQARWKEDQIHRKIQRWLCGQFLEELIRYQVESRKGQWRLQFDFDRRLGSGSSIIVWVAPCCLPIAWIGPPSKSPSATPPHRTSRESFGVSRTATGWAGDRCIRGPIARSASMPSTACWASPYSSTSTNRRRPPGMEFP